MKRSSSGDASDFASTGLDDAAAAEASATTIVRRLGSSAALPGSIVASVWQ
ncbi:MAG TPA: hypothetical protein VF760_10245 [Xanthobacteraceae bacterium]